ncbi:MAG: HD domain-containing protein [Bdellovibrionota bacterium]
MAIGQDQARDLAQRLAGAAHSRRLYAEGSPIWQKTIEALKQEVDKNFPDGEAAELTFALLGDGLAVGGVPVNNAPANVVRFVAQMKLRDIEIISLKRDCAFSDLETLLGYLAADAADVAAVKASTWLKERGVDRITVKHLKLTAGAAAGIESFRDVYRVGSQSLGREFRRAAETGTVDMAPLTDLAKSLFDLTVGSDAPVATLLALRDRDDYTFVHSLNVGTMAGCQAAALGLSENEIQEISLSGLLHDIGKTKVPDGVLQKRGPLNVEEKALLARHTIEGAKILFATQGAERFASVVANEHHLPAAGEPGKEPPILASQLVALADTFDTIRTLRPFDDREGMRQALAYMFEKLPGRFNPYLLGRFATMCGMFSPGDMVRLSTGEIGKVVRPHPESALHPTVEVTQTGGGRSPAGTQIDLTRAGRGPDAPRLVLPLSGAIGQLDPKEIDWLG